VTAEVAVLGATGTTGRHVARALAAAGLRVRVGGRRLADADGVASELAGATPVLCDARDPASVRRLADGAAAVVSCAGPFTALGPAACEAVVGAGAHWLDVGAEQGFVLWCQRELDARARAAGVVVANAVGVEVALADLGGALAARSLDSVDSVDVYTLWTGIRASAGSLRTAAAVGAERTWRWEDGPVERRGGGATRRRPFPAFGVDRVVWLGGVEHLTLPRHVPARRVDGWWGAPTPVALAMRASAALTPGPVFRRLSTVAGRLVPTRSGGGGRFRIEVEAAGRVGDAQAAARVGFDGGDPYLVTGAIVAWVTAELLTRGAHAGRAGTLAPAEVVDPARFLRAAPSLGLTAEATGPSPSRVEHA
jgi:hypothetical protein